MAALDGGPMTRDRLLEFVALRKAARRQDEWLNRANNGPSSSSSFQGRRAGGDPDEEEQQPVVAPTPPPWVRVMENFTGLEGTVSSRIDSLHSKQRDFLSPRFISADEEEDQQHELEVLAHDIQKLLKELERMVLTGVRPSDPKNDDEVCAAKNVQKHLTSRLTALMNAFRDGQQFFVDQLRKRNEKVKKFKQVGSAEVHQQLEREEKVAQYLELGYTQADIHELLVEEERQREVSDEVQNILSSIKELHEMFKDLSAMVVEQGTVLDRVDHNIMKASQNTAKGLEQLKKAREHQKSCAVQ